MRPKESGSAGAALPAPATSDRSLRFHQPVGFVLNIGVTTQRDSCFSATIRLRLRHRGKSRESCKSPLVFPIHAWDSWPTLRGENGENYTKKSAQGCCCRWCFCGFGCSNKNGSASATTVYVWPTRGNRHFWVFSG